MSDKLGVAVDCTVKAIYDKAFTAEFKKIIIDRFKKDINSSSKLEVDDDTKKGFSLTATLDLTRDDKMKPPQLKGIIPVAIMTIGLQPSTLNIKPTSPGLADVGSNPRSTASQAKALIDALLDKAVPKAITGMESKVP